MRTFDPPKLRSARAHFAHDLRSGVHSIGVWEPRQTSSTAAEPDPALDMLIRSLEAPD